MRSYFQDSRRDNNSSKVVILFLFLMAMLVLILSGKIPYLSKNKPTQDPSQHPIDSEVDSTTQYDKYPVFQQPIGAYYNFENIDIHWIGETSNSVTLSVGVEGVFNKYTLVVDTEVKIVNNDSWVIKTSDTYVQIIDTNYYLYAFRSNDRGAVFIGIARDNNAMFETPEEGYIEEGTVN